MKGVPAVWNTIVDSANMITIEELASAMEYFNDQLIKATDYNNSQILKRIKELERNINQGSRHNARAHEIETVELEAEALQIGQKSNNFNKSKFNNDNKPKAPPADHVISKGRTPAEAGGQPCRHCNSSKHWDYDCPHSMWKSNNKPSKFKKGPFKKKFNRFKKNFRKAQTKFVNMDEDSWEATANYIDEGMQDISSSNSSSSSEETSESSESEENEDF